MEIKSTRLLPIIVIGFIIIVIIVGSTVMIGSKKKNTALVQNEPLEVFDLSTDDLKILGMRGDTEKDTVQTLITLVKTIKSEQSKTNEKLKKLEDDNKRLTERANQLKNGYNSDYKIQPKDKTQHSDSIDSGDDIKTSALSKKIDDLTSQFNNLTNRLNNTFKKSSLDESISIGKTKNNTKSLNQSPSVNQGEIIWIMPADQIVVSDTRSSQGNKGFTYPNLIKETIRENKDENKAESKGKNIDRKPVYTIPKNSTLNGSVSMTALLGRIPIDGKVTDPYPFKVIIGRENLIANGIELPHIESAVVSGTTTGDYTLSCVRGSVRSITFVFDDGRISTYPTNDNKSDEIGWISDQYGIPCVSGDIKSNANEYLGTVFALGTASAAADSFSQQNTTVIADGSNITSAVTGNNSQYVLGKGIAGGIKETIDWYNKRYGQTFDAVYVPPGKTIAVHITKELDIDYLHNGRLVDYKINSSLIGELD